MQAGTAMVVIRRALLIMLVIGWGGLLGLVAAFVLGAAEVFRLRGGDDTCAQPDEQAEYQEPCEEVAHLSTRKSPEIYFKENFENEKFTDGNPGGESADFPPVDFA